MNPHLLSFVLVVAAMGGPAPAKTATFSARDATELALSADTVVLNGETDLPAEGIELKDRAWIARFAAALSSTDFSTVDLDRNFGVGWETAYFYRGGRRVLSVAAMSRHELRVQWQGSEGDFIVAGKQWKAIDRLIKGAPALHNAERVEELALSADAVRLRGEIQPASSGVVVHDRQWIVRFAAALRHTHLSQVDHVFGVGWLAAYFYRDGKRVLSVEPIDSGDGGAQTLRVFSGRHGGDFVVSAKQCKVIEALMREKMRAGHGRKTAPGRRPPSPPSPFSGAHQRYHGSNFPSLGSDMKNNAPNRTAAPAPDGGFSLTSTELDPCA